MDIAVTGASGLIGSHLVAALRAGGDAVRVLVRRPVREPGEVHWDPAAGVLDPAGLRGVDAVVHLAGAGVGDHRWTTAYRQQILDSRVQSTALIARTLADLDTPPAVLLSASAIGFYGDTGDRAVDERSGPGRGFLAEVCVAWEAATAPASAAGIRVAHLRTGIVLSPDGGALAKQLPLFRLGVGGPLGNGRQYQSWIALRDEVAAIRFLLADPVAGPVNLTGPLPVTQKEFARTLGAAVRRPAVLPAPAVALRLALGGFADEGVLASQRVVPRLLQDRGFAFAAGDLATALALELG